jgi:signal transduction histidine kinase
MPADEQIALYRITQEALHNICKHAAASQVMVCLSADADHLELTIEDDGRGFDTTCVATGHFGVEVMRERAEGMGAAFHIDSAPGRGTRLRILRTCPAAA